MPTQVPDLSGQRVVFRLDRGFRKPLVIRGGLALGAAVLAGAAGAAVGPPMFVIAVLCALVAACCAVSYLWKGRFQTVLTPEGIQARGYFNHFVPWSAVAGVRVSRRGSSSSFQEDGGVSAGERIQTYRMGRGGGVVMSAGGRGRPYQLNTVRVVRVSGRRLTLPAPRVTSWQGDSEFYDKAALIEQWRKRYGAPQLGT
jgi:hypothetical protein